MFMNKTRRIDSTLPQPTAKQRRAMVSTGQRITVAALRAACQHANVITLADGVTVCTSCGKVSK